MKKILSILVFLFCAAFCGAGEGGKMTVAVLGLDANGVYASDAKALTDRLRVELFMIGKFDVMERDKMDALLTEQKLGALGTTSTREVIEIGKIISVNGMVSGSVSRLGRKYLVNVQMVDVETGMILATAIEECECRLEDLASHMYRVAEKLANVEKRAEFTIQYYDKDNRAKGNFYIKSVPSGATVYINNKMIRNVVTPLTIEYLPAGRYRIRAEKDDYARSAAVTLSTNEFKRVELDLVKKQGALAVTSNIPQSDVFLNNQFMGKTPLTIKPMDVGMYSLKVKKSGYIKFSEQIEITDLQQTQRNIHLIKPGPLKILSVPMEASLYLDEEYKGQTPIVLTNLSAELHTLELRKAGYETHRETLTIDSDEETKIEPTLVPLAGTVVEKEPEEEQHAGTGLDKVMKWITIAGGAVFAGVMVLAAVN